MKVLQEGDVSVGAKREGGGNKGATVVKRAKKTAEDVRFRE